MALPNSEKITSQLAMLPDAALKQMAMMHKSDPYVLPLIVSEDGRRKQMRQAAQAQMAAMPQPRVADAAVAQVGTLPEEQGIGQLPAPNIQRMADGGIAGYEDPGLAMGGSMFDFAQRSEPVLRMAGGGIAGYVPSFRNTGAVNAAFEDALQNTLRYEGGYVADDAGKGPSNFGINKAANPDLDIKKLTKEQARDIYKKRYWDAIGGDSLAQQNPALAKVAFDTAVNMGPDKAKQLVAQSKGDPAQILKMRQAHYDNLVEADPEKFGKYEKSWSNRLADLATKIVPSAQAGTLPASNPADAASQIPGYSGPVPASTYDQTNSYFGRLADTMGISPEVQRNINNTLNAMSGWTSPISTANRAVGSASGALKATPEMIAKAEQSKKVAETQRLLPPAKAGLEALDAASQETRAAAEAAKRARALAEDQKAATAAEQSVKAADLTSDAARAMEESIAAGPNARALDSAKAANAARALSTGQAFDGGGESPAASSTGINTAGADLSKFYDMGATAPEAAPKPSDLIEATKDTVPAKDRKGFDNEDLLTLGLSLLANKSPNFMTAVGEAGLQTLSAKKEREKRETDLEYKDIMKKYYGALGTKAETEAEQQKAGTKYNAVARQHAMDNIQREMAKWEASLGGATATPQEIEAKRLSLAKFYFPLAGLELPSTMNAPAPTSGFKVLGSRPQ